MPEHKFHVHRLERLNDPARFEALPPDVLWEALGSPQGETYVIEVGAGTGMFAAAFLARSPELVVYAADIADEMLAWMQTNRPEVAEGRLFPVKADEVDIPLPDAMADAAYSIDLHHELAEPRASYAEVLRLLKPGGRMLVVDWARRETPSGPPPELRAEPEGAAAMLESAGFVDVRVEADRLPWHWMVSARKR